MRRLLASCIFLLLLYVDCSIKTERMMNVKLMHLIFGHINETNVKERTKRCTSFFVGRICRDTLIPPSLVIFKRRRAAPSSSCKQRPIDHLLLLVFDV